MVETQLAEIYNQLKEGQKVDLVPFAKEEYKEYVDTPKGEKLVTEMTLQMKGTRQSVLIAELYRDKLLLENHWYYLDQLPELKKLLAQWLK